jgi:Tfp pilus assembly protein PilX
MYEKYSRRKAVVLVIVLGIALVVSTLVLAALSLMTQESRVAEGKIKRIRAFYAVQAGMVNAVEDLRKSNSIGGSGTLNTIYVGAGLNGYPTLGIPVNIQRANGVGIGGTDMITINANY